MKTTVVGESAALEPGGERLADGVDDIVHLLYDVRVCLNLDNQLVERAEVSRRLLIRPRRVEAREGRLAEALDPRSPKLKWSGHFYFCDSAHFGKAKWFFTLKSQNQDGMVN